MEPPSSELKKQLTEAAELFHSRVGEAGEYLQGRGISRLDADSFKLGIVPADVNGYERWAGRLSIPYLTKGGVTTIKFRCIKHEKCEGHPKYDGIPGRNALYNVQALFDASDMIAVTEGELDAMVLSLRGIPAVGIPGATNYQKHYTNIFQDFRRVVAFLDGDVAKYDAKGKRMPVGSELFGKKLSETVGARLVQCPPGEDVSSILMQDGGLDWIKEKMRE